LIALLLLTKVEFSRKIIARSFSPRLESAWSQNQGGARDCNECRLNQNFFTSLWATPFGSKLYGANGVLWPVVLTQSQRGTGSGEAAQWMTAALPEGHS